MRPPRALAAEIAIIKTKEDRRAALAAIEPPLIRGLVERHVRIFFERRAHVKSCLDGLRNL